MGGMSPCPRLCKKESSHGQPALGRTDDRLNCMKPENPENSDEFIPTRSSLLTRLKDWDDNESWREFFNTYWKLIYGTAIKAGLSDAEAQDVVQETVLSVAKKMRDFKYDPALGSFKGWLLQLTRWRITNQWKKRLPTQSLKIGSAGDTAHTSAEERMPDEGLNIEQFWEEDWKKNLVDAAIERVKQKVNPKQYKIFYLQTVKKLPVKEVAKAMGVNIAQVYLAKHRVAKWIEKDVRYLERKMI